MPFVTPPNYAYVIYTGQPHPHKTQDMLIQGDFVRLPRLGELEILEDHLLAVDDISGLITHFEKSTSPQSIQTIKDSPAILKVIPAGSFLMPIFCDLHLHAPQYLYQGTGLHLPLMQWLNEYAFKAEERIDADSDLARRVYTRLAHRLIQNGTGAVLLFGTIKEESNLILAEVMQASGIRAFVGKLSMDISSRPTYKEDSPQASLQCAASFVDRCRLLFADIPPHRRLVEPVLTPRFVPTCSDELLMGLGTLSARQNLKIQSHMAEAHDQVDWVRRERGMEDIEVFDRHHLLTPRTIQAHCTFLTTPELSRVAKSGTAIAHCPLSNMYFSAEPFHLREALQEGVTVGLGTDVAGGYSLDIMNAMRNTVSVSKMREGARLLSCRSRNVAPHSDGNVSINWKESLYLATQGGAQALGLPLGSGNFKVGCPFDAQCIRVFEPATGLGAGNLDFFDLKSPENTVDVKLTTEMVEKWWSIGDVGNRTGVWVQGRMVSRETN